MKIEDYKNVTDRIEIREECRKEIINMSIEKNKSKHKWSKKTFIPVIAAAIVGSVSYTHLDVYKRQLHSLILTTATHSLNQL